MNMPALSRRIPVCPFAALGVSYNRVDEGFAITSEECCKVMHTIIVEKLATLQGTDHMSRLFRREEGNKD